MPKEENIKQFERQIETSLELQIQRLQIIDAEKSATLSSLKEAIVSLIKREKEDKPCSLDGVERMSSDLMISEQELEEIFNITKEKYGDLFQNAEINNFAEFKILLGLDAPKESIRFVKKMHNVEIFGIPITIELPLGVSDEILEGYNDIVQQIKGRKDLAPYFNEGTKIVTSGKMQVEFTITRDGKSVKYTVTPYHILRVDKEPNPTDLVELIKIHSSIMKLRKQIENAHLDEKTKESIFYLIDIEPQKALPDQSQIPEEYIELIKTLRELTSKRHALLSKCEHRILYDEISKITVLETKDPIDDITFKYTYLDSKGEIERYVSRDTGFMALFDKYSPEPKGVLQKRIYFDKTQTIVSTSDRSEKGIIQTTDTYYDESGNIKCRMISIGAKKEEKYYDENGNPLYQVHIDGQNTSSTLLRKNGEPFGDYKSEKTKSGLTEVEYITAFKETIRTGEQFYIAEELFGEQGYGLSPIAIRQIRQYGKDITGVTAEEIALERDYGININTEIWEDKRTTNIPYSIKNIESILIDLRKELAKLPPGFIKTAGLEQIHIFNNWTDLLEDGRTIYPGGRYFSRHTIGILGGRSFQHELFHCMDDQDGMTDDDDEWGTTAHGKDYKKLYGKNGAEAMKTKANKQPRPPGFVNSYAKAGSIVEDQAKTWEYMMANDPEVWKNAENEPALAKKVEMIKAMAFKWSHGQMDEQFWKDLRNNVIIDETYWQKRRAKN